MQAKLIALVSLTALSAFAQGTYVLRFGCQGTNFQAGFDVPAELVYTSTNFLVNQVFYDSLQAVTPEGVTWRYDPSNPNDYAQGSIETDGAPDFTIRLVDLSSMTILTLVGHGPSGFISEDHFGGSTIIEGATWSAQYVKTPEPSAGGLLVMGLLALAIRRRSR